MLNYSITGDKGNLLEVDVGEEEVVEEVEEVVEEASVEGVLPEVVEVVDLGVVVAVAVVSGAEEDIRCHGSSCFPYQSTSMSWLIVWLWGVVFVERNRVVSLISAFVL